MASIADHRIADEHVDVRTQAAPLVAQIKTDARRTRFERTHHASHIRRFDFQRLSFQLREEGEQMPGKVDLNHAAEVGTSLPSWQRGRRNT